MKTNNIKYGLIYITKGNGKTIEDIKREYPDWVIRDDNEDGWILSQGDEDSLTNGTVEHTKNLGKLMWALDRVLDCALENDGFDRYRCERYHMRYIKDKKIVKEMVDEEEAEELKMNYDSINGLLDCAPDYLRDFLEP